jgi:hypothetical protein
MGWDKMGWMVEWMTNSLDFRFLSIININYYPARVAIKINKHKKYY